MATKHDISGFVNRIAQYVWNSGQEFGDCYVKGDNKSKKGTFIPPWMQAKVKLDDGSNAVLNLVDYDIGKLRLEIIVSHGDRPYDFNARLFVNEEVMSIGEDFPARKVLVGETESFYFVTESHKDKVYRPNLLEGIIEEIHKKLFSGNGLVGI